MDDFELSRFIRSELSAQGLIARDLKEGFRAWMDTNLLKFAMPDDPKAIARIVEIARSQSDDERYGMHVVFLNARLSTSGENVYWSAYQPYGLTLKEYLLEHGHSF